MKAFLIQFGGRTEKRETTAAMLKRSMGFTNATGKGKGRGATEAWGEKESLRETMEVMEETSTFKLTCIKKEYEL